MRFLTASSARDSAFDCGQWSLLAPNATCELIARGGYVHDVYTAPFTGDFERAAQALLHYKIFAPQRMVSHVCTADHRVAIGATVVQRVVLGPMALETAVKVVEVEHSADRVCFAYATLAGHAERGIASFAVLRGKAGNTFEAQAWSRSGNWLTILGRPVSRALQRALTREAVATFCASVA